MTTEAKPSRLLDASEIESMALPDDSMPETPTTGKPAIDVPASASVHYAGLESSDAEPAEATLPADPPTTS